MKKVALTFIIPAFNSVRYIRSCLDSIFNQTNDNYEVIIINDGSTDGTQKILEEYLLKYKNKLRVFQQENKGISAARNRGILESKGEYITFIDHDDWIENCYVEEVLNIIKRKRFDALVFGYETVDNKNRTITKYPVSKNIEWARWGICTVWLLVAKKSIYMENNIRFPVGLFNEDIPVSIKVAYYSKNFGILDKNLYHYRVYLGNTCSKIHTKYEQSPESRKNVFAELKNIMNLVENQKEKELITYNAVKFYYGLLLVYFKNESKENLLDEYKKYTDAICKFFPEYKKLSVSIFKPKGEPLKKRIAVFLSIWFDRLG